VNVDESGAKLLFPFGIDIAKKGEREVDLLGIEPANAGQARI
jgi:hypothetical protein